MEQTSEATAETEGKTVVVSRTLKQPVKVVWDVLMTDDGAEALLGPGAKLGAKGHTWQAYSGRGGVIRSFHPLEEIRFSYRSKDDAKPSMVTLNLKPAGEGETEIEIEHSNLGPDIDREWAKDRWSAALERIESDAL
ncbi:SRPBCC domain-containing protein [Propionimicrobium sp. PCR01-08-3]|uniref:SRPBCC domain-containing protein n=1 Tax=Propionimicrobium sp. PCR01-08-3 TaxID=3052086 RepID=UPI00255C6078|nr:SRPBCC domain-containing protein [Propionimicrobium sp. PCR01-08-3]WIY83064.1 SRPBCC domain-containing protein [Propionimicrobium sp. PCR01-08-3]